MANVIPQLNEDMQARAQRNPQLCPGTNLSLSQDARLQFPKDFSLPAAAGNGASPCIEEIVPSYPPRAPIMGFEELPNVTLELVEMLAGGFDRLSQTYLCKTDRSSHQVVLKLFQQEYMPCPLADDGFTATSLDEVYRDWPLAEKLYCTEALAFERLKGYQGTRLPYSYGFYHVTLPSGDMTVGHLMEYIDYPLPHEMGNAQSIDWIEFMKQFVDCLLDFKKHSVEHSDIAARNIRAFRIPDQTAWQFILLDWASATFEWDEYFGFKDWDTMSVLATDLSYLSVPDSEGDPARWLWEEGRENRALLLDKSRYPDFADL